MTENDYASNRVPMQSRIGIIKVTLVRIGYLTSLGQFMLGATLGHSMTFRDAILATFFGSLILEFVSLGLGLAGMKEGLSTSILAKWCGFGKIGSAIIGLAIATSLLGWFGIQNSVLAEGIQYTFDYKINFTLTSALSGLCLTFLVAFGFRALSFTALISVPLFFIVIGYIFFILTKDFNIIDVFNKIPNGNRLTISEGATIVAGGCIAGTLTTPDISRYCRNTKDVILMSTISIIVGPFIVTGIAILIAHALNTADVVKIMTTSAGVIGLLTVILSAIKVNDVNLYSSSLGIANTIEIFTGKKFKYFQLTLIVGCIGTLLSMLGILTHFTNFLSLLGTIFPPITGVMLVDYYILRTSRKILDASRENGMLPNELSTPLIGWPAIMACILGAIVGIEVKVGIPSLNSILMASIVYFLLMKTKIFIFENKN